MPNLSKEIVNFAMANTGKTDFYVAFQDYFAHYVKENNGVDIGVYDNHVSLSEKSNKMQELFFQEVETLANVSRSGNAETWARHPSVKWAAFAVVDATINAILPLTINRSIGLYTDLHYVSVGDIVKVRVKPRTLFTVSRGGTGERQSFRQKKYDGDVIISMQERIITTYTDMYRVLAGKEDIAEFVRLAVISIETAITRDATLALTTGLNNSAYPAALRYTGNFDRTALLKMGEVVEAYNFGARPVIAGTATALANVTGDSSLGQRGVYSIDGRDNRIALLDNFYGFDLLRLPQVADGDYTTMGLALPDDTLFIISPAQQKLVFGAISNTLSNSNQFYENADITSNTTLRKEWGLEYVGAAFGGIYKITG